MSFGVSNFYLSDTGNGSGEFWVDELRVSKGVARWTSEFTPPSEEYSEPIIVYASAAVRADAREQANTAAAPRYKALRDFLYSAATPRADSRARTQADAAPRADASAPLAFVAAAPRFDALRNFLHARAAARADARAQANAAAAPRADARARTFAVAQAGADARAQADSAAAPGADALCQSGADFYRRDPATGEETWLGFVPGDFSAPLALSGVTLADGAHDLVVRPRAWFWRDCRSSAFARVTIAAGGAATVVTLPEIASLSAETRYGETLISWDVTAPLGADADGFRLWFSATSPVPTTGAPAATVAYLSGLSEYSDSRVQTADEYVALKVYRGDTESAVTELHLAMDAALASPAGQHAANG